MREDRKRLDCKGVRIWSIIKAKVGQDPWQGVWYGLYMPFNVHPPLNSSKKTVYPSYIWQSVGLCDQVLANEM